MWADIAWGVLAFFGCSTCVMGWLLAIAPEVDFENGEAGLAQPALLPRRGYGD